MESVQDVEPRQPTRLTLKLMLPILLSLEKRKVQPELLILSTVYILRSKSHLYPC